MPEATRSMKPLKAEHVAYLQMLAERLSYHQAQWQRCNEEAQQADKTLYVLQMVEKRARGNDVCKVMLAAQFTQGLTADIASYALLAKRHEQIIKLLEDELGTFLHREYRLGAKQQWNLDLNKKALYRMPPLDLNGGIANNGAS